MPGMSARTRGRYRRVAARLHRWPPADRGDRTGGRHVRRARAEPAGERVRGRHRAAAAGPARSHGRGAAASRVHRCRALLHAVGEATDYTRRPFDAVSIESVLAFRIDDLIRVCGLSVPTRMKIDGGRLRAQGAGGRRGPARRGPLRPLHRTGRGRAGRPASADGGRVPGRFGLSSRPRRTTITAPEPILASSTLFTKAWTASASACCHDPRFYPNRPARADGGAARELLPQPRHRVARTGRACATGSPSCTVPRLEDARLETQLERKRKRMVFMGRGLQVVESEIARVAERLPSRAGRALAAPARPRAGRSSTAPSTGARDTRRPSVSRRSRAWTFRPPVLERMQSPRWRAFLATPRALRFWRWIEAAGPASETVAAVPREAQPRCGARRADDLAQVSNRGRLPARRATARHPDHRLPSTAGTT